MVGQGSESEADDDLSQQYLDTLEDAREYKFENQYWSGLVVLSSWQKE